MIELKGIAWNHMRGFVSVVATAQRFEERHPEVRITWEKRSLQAFADASMADLANHYDLIVMDHPHTALAATERLLLPFEDWLPAEFIADQRAHSVGGSCDSYRFEDKQWTLATDAATPIATWRPDLLERHGLSLPKTWQEVLDLAAEGYVTSSLFPIDVLMNSYMFCQAQGETPFATGNGLASTAVLAEALEQLRKLASLCDPECLQRNPIRTAEWMSQNDDPRAAYCPFAYGYSNYSRPRYAPYVLHAGGLVEWNGTRLRSTLGGAGLAVSSKTAAPEQAMAYAAFTASPETQKGLYFEAGGQPGHRAAWTDGAVNAACNHFFRNTLDTLDNAILRPKHPRYMDFQDAATPIAHAAVTGKLSVADATRQINAIWQNIQ